MQPKPYKPPMTLLLIAILVALLVVLAFLQYRWVGQISVAERQTMQTNLRNQARGLQEEVSLEIDKAGARLQLSVDSVRNESWEELIKRYQRWKTTAAYPGLIKSLFLAHLDRDRQFDLLQLDDSTLQFKPIAWPAEFDDIRLRLNPARFSSGSERVRREPGPMEGREFGSLIEHGYTLEAIPAIARFTVEMESFDETNNAEPRRRMGPESINTFLESPLAIMVLDIDYIKLEMVPALFKRRFTSDGALDYDMSIVYRQPAEERSEKAAREHPDMNATPARLGDATFNIFSAGTNSSEQTRGPRWQVIINHRAGSLDAAVAQARRRNLLASFGILSLLGVSLVVIIVSSRRAQRLARKQMDFVAGVSHEFRTPLAVIHAISENLADGLITDKQQIQQCGEVIRNDTRRLAGMVEQVLEFAGASRTRNLYQPQPVDVKELIEQAVESNPVLTSNGDWQIEKDYDRGELNALADPTALASAVRNIIDNAVKYGGDHRWIGITANPSPNGATPMIEITIADKGIGIAQSDLPHIFDPFYRGREVVASQLHGNGLGLSLVKNIVEAHGGTISVSSVQGEGSRFSLRLPAVGP